VVHEDREGNQKDDARQPDTRRRKICTGVKLRMPTMPACVVGVLRSAMRPNAAASASEGAESAPAAATLNVGVAGEDATPASVGLDPSFCCGIEGASLCSIGFAAAGEDVATVSVGLNPSTCSVLPCGSFCCGIEGASLSSIGFAAAGEDVATASACLDPSTCSALSCGMFSRGTESASPCSIGFAAAGEDTATCIDLYGISLRNRFLVEPKAGHPAG
jgi:hypothetical protein